MAQDGRWFHGQIGTGDGEQGIFSKSSAVIRSNFNKFLGLSGGFTLLGARGASVPSSVGSASLSLSSSSYTAAAIPASSMGFLVISANLCFQEF